MVFVILTRSGFGEIESRVLVGHDAVWVNAGVLSRSEVAGLRDRGWDLTAWTGAVEMRDLTPALDTVRLHHPGQVIWVEAAPGQPPM